MRNDRLRIGFRAGLVGGATTAGALVGLGLRHAAAAAPFEAGGRALLQSWHVGFVAAPVAIVTGFAAHLLWMTLWGVCFARAATQLRGPALAAGAVIFVALIGALSATIVPGALGAAAPAALTLAQTLFFLALLAAGLTAGVSLARKLP
ncbi:MAG: hypothetical protein ABIZ91_10880 [Gemmatimonadaceae bacterium]